MDALRALRVLGLPPGASADEIQAAWRDLAQVWHPDRFTAQPRLQAKAADNLQRINEAHEVLRRYDPSAPVPVHARVRESVSIILGMGDLGPPPDDQAGAAGASGRGAAGRARRASMMVLGVGKFRPTTEIRMKRRVDRRPMVAALVLAAVAIAALVAAWLALR